MASREAQKANVKRGAAMRTMRALVVFSTVLCPQLGLSQPAGVVTERGLQPRIMLKSMPLRGVLQPLPPAPQAGSPATQIRDYLDGLPRLALVYPKAGTPVAMVGLPEGVAGTQIVGGSFVNEQAELALLKSFPDITWPGALVQGQTIADNDFAPIILPRSGGRIRLATNFILPPGAKQGPQSQSVDLPSIDPG